VLCCILSKFKKVIMLKLCAYHVVALRRPCLYQYILYKVITANDLLNSSEEGRSHDIVSIEFKN